MALFDNGRMVERYEEAGRSHSERLMELVAEVLATAQTNLRDLDAIAANIGPGGFTGVRVTVSVAQGLAFGAGLPAVGVSSLEALAAQVLGPPGQAVLCCLDARMAEVYWGLFTLGSDGLPQVTSAPAVSSPGSVRSPAAGALGIGRGFTAYPQLTVLPGLSIGDAAALALPRAAEVARLGARRLAAGGGLDPAGLQPLYVREKVALTELERRGR